jgi:uncharacterized membrane protein
VSGTSWRKLLTTAGTSGGAAAESAAKTLSTKYLGGVPGAAEPPNRWLAVTVNCPAERLADLPAPVAELSDIAEVRVRPAPGGRGTELAMRLREQPPVGAAGLPARLSGNDPRQLVPGRNLHPALPAGLFDRLTALGRNAARRLNQRPTGSLRP